MCGKENALPNILEMTILAKNAIPHSRARTKNQSASCDSVFVHRNKNRENTTALTLTRHFDTHTAIKE
jgi:hypothetical protein